MKEGQKARSERSLDSTTYVLIGSAAVGDTLRERYVGDILPICTNQGDFVTVSREDLPQSEQGDNDIASKCGYLAFSVDKDGHGIVGTRMALEMIRGNNGNQGTS